MPKQQSTEKEPAHIKETVEQKLDRIAESLRRLDRRDKIRTSWMTVRSIIGIIPILAIIGSAVYVYWKREDFFQSFTKSIVTQVQKPETLLKQLEQFLR